MVSGCNPGEPSKLHTLRGCDVRYWKAPMWVFSDRPVSDPVSILRAEALKAIVRNGYSEKQGARRMRNAAREAVQEAVREALLGGRATSGRLEYDDHSKSFFINGQR